jgi:hypothetical protein
MLEDRQTAIVFKVLIQPHSGDGSCVGCSPGWPCEPQSAPDVGPCRQAPIDRRHRANRKISRRRPRSPQLAGSCGCVSVSAETVSGLKAILGGLSLGRGIPFPRCRLILDEDWSECGG